MGTSTRQRDTFTSTKLTAAVYARKSTEQNGADADAKSCARQIENARAFARSRGWDVTAAHVYADDAISGAEIKKLVNRQRLLNAFDGPRPPFQILLMRDASRFSRRDGDEAFAELKGLAKRGVEIWFYQDGTRFQYGTFDVNISGMMRAEMNAEYRRSIAKWTQEAMLRKARAGHVTGGVCFGYDNIKVDGHTDRRINEAEAIVIRRIFAMCASGAGYSRIAHALNDAVAPSPRAQQGRPRGWSPSSVREVLHRDAYCGKVIYNRTRQRDPDGTSTYADRPESEWVRCDRPDLRIVVPEMWTAVRQRLDVIRANLVQKSGGRIGRRRRDIESAYLLSGFARCVCGSSIGALDRHSYGCLAHKKKGTTVCPNGLKKPIAALDAAILASIRAVVLRPRAIMATIDRALDLLAAPTRAGDRKQLDQELRTLDGEIANLSSAIAQGGNLPPLLEALTARTARRESLREAIASHDTGPVMQFDRAAVERKVRACLAEWQSQLDGKVDRTRQALRQILGPLTLTPEGRTYRFKGELLVGRLIAGTVPDLATFMASPPGSPHGRENGSPCVWTPINSWFKAA